MRAENFIAFFTVCGFFVGIVFTLLKVSEPVEMLIYTLVITLFFYLIIHIVIMNYIDVKRALNKIFDKQRHEEIADYLISELNTREKRMENIMVKMATENFDSGKRNARTKAKAA
ncbi:hypothetical protein [Campylobacter sp.]|uniref:hypothetical protein n=1 Tax=Campylobacter sp. TaxID=205 RepID=UPI003F9F377E